MTTTVYKTSLGDLHRVGEQWKSSDEAVVLRELQDGCWVLTCRVPGTGLVGATPTFFGGTPEEAIEVFEKQLAWYNGADDTPDEIETVLGTFRRDAGLWILKRDGVNAVLYMAREPETLSRYWVFGFDGLSIVGSRETRGRTPMEAMVTKLLMGPYVAMVDNFRVFDIRI